MQCMGRGAGERTASFTFIYVSKAGRQRSGHAFAKGRRGGEPNVSQQVLGPLLMKTRGKSNGAAWGKGGSLVLPMPILVKST